MAKKEKKTNKSSKKENSKNKKSFFKDFKAELKKVVWPTPKQLFNNTIAVVTIVLITAAIVFVLDGAFKAINKHGVDKIKEVVESTSENTTTDDENVSNDDNTSVDNVEVQETEEGTTDNTETTENQTTENNAE